MRSARRPRRSSSCTIASTAVASARATSTASPLSATAVSLMGVAAHDRVQLVLESARLDRAVDAALLGRTALPPPAPGTRLLARRDRTRARRAADGGVAARIQGVSRDVVLAHVVPDLFLAPLGQRVELDDGVVVVVDLDLADVRARRPLVAAQPGDPGVEALQVLRQRLHLAGVAADQPLLHGVAEAVRPLPLDESPQLARIRGEQLQPQLRVALADRVREVVRLLREASGVNAEHAHVRADPCGHVDQDATVDLECGRDRNAVKTLECPLEHRLGLLALEFHRQLAGLELIEQLRAHSASSRTRPLTGSSPAARPSSSSLWRRANTGNASSSPLRPSSQPWMSPATAASSSSLGTRRNNALPICASGPRPPRTKMSYACTRLPSASRAVVPWNPRSAIQCCAHACGQPSSCRPSELIASPKRSSRYSISRPRRCFVSVTEKLQCGSPVQPTERPRTWLTASEKPMPSSSAMTPGTLSSGTLAMRKFCCRVMRTSAPARSTRSATAIIWSPEISPRCTGTPM